MAEIFEKAWGNYVALFEFLTDPDAEEGGFNEQHGLVQTYNFASLVPYDLAAPNYNIFLLLNAVNYVAPGVAYEDTTDHLEKGTRLEHVAPLVHSYERFLNQLDSLIVNALNPAQLAEYHVRERKVSDAQLDLQNYETFVHDKWADWVSNNPGIPPEQLPDQRVIFERDRSYSTTIERKRRNVQFENAQINAWLRDQLPPELHLLLNARKYYDDPGYKIDLPISANHDKADMKRYWRSHHMQMPTFDYEEFLENDVGVSSRFSTREEHYSRVETHWKAKAKGRWGIFSGSAAAEKRKLEELSTKTHFAITISFSRFQEVPIFRDGWFVPQLFDTVGADLKEYWGPGGLLATYPVSLFICRGLKISVEISEEYKRTLEKFFKAGGSASFGPFFSGGGSYVKDEKYMDFKLTEQGFELFDDPVIIRLLGARVRRPNWSDREAELYQKGLDVDGLTGAIAFLRPDRPPSGSSAPKARLA